MSYEYSSILLQRLYKLYYIFWQMLLGHAKHGYIFKLYK